MTNFVRKACSIACLLAVCGGPVEARAAANVVGLDLASSTRVGRTTIDYGYRLRVTNGNPALTGVAITVTSTSSRVVVVDGSVTIGDLAAGTNVTSSDTITVRLDRTVAFDPSVLKYSIAGSPSTAQPIAGDPGLPARIAIPEIHLVEDYPSSAFEIEDGGWTLRSLIGILLDESCTVGQANAAITAAGGRIVRAMQGTGVVWVRITDPGSMAAVEELLDDLAQLPGVRGAVLESAPLLAAADARYSTDDAGLDFYAHALASRLHGAWNAVAANHGLDLPGIYHPDTFSGVGPSPANTALAARSVPGEDFGISSGDQTHGYGVAGLIAGSLGSGRGAVPGAYPGPHDLPYWAFTFCLSEALCEFERMIVGVGAYFPADPLGERIASGLKVALDDSQRTRRVVANFSLTGSWHMVKAACAGRWDVVQHYVDYWRDLTASLPTDRLAIVAAAGNASSLKCPEAASSLEAEDIAPWNALAGTNTLMVENRSSTIDAGRVVPNSLRLLGSLVARASDRAVSAAGAWRGGQMRALSGPSATELTSGTSFSAPQVSGTAAYLWALNPGLDSAEVMDLIRFNARADTPGGPSAAWVGSPFLDAYASVLALDDPNAALAGAEPLSSDVVPIRSAVFNVDTTDGFGLIDFSAFLTAFAEESGSRVVDEGRFKLDRARMDLNGDGFVAAAVSSGGQGGSTQDDFTGRDRFNLDLSANGWESTYQVQVEYPKPQSAESELTTWILGCPDCASTGSGGIEIGLPPPVVSPPEYFASTPLPVEFSFVNRADETRASDLDILCYYLNSALFSGSDDERRQANGMAQISADGLSSFGCTPAVASVLASTRFEDHSVLTVTAIIWAGSPLGSPEAGEGAAAPACKELAEARAAGARVFAANLEMSWFRVDGTTQWFPVSPAGGRCPNFIAIVDRGAGSVPRVFGALSGQSPKGPYEVAFRGAEQKVLCRTLHYPVYVDGFLIDPDFAEDVESALCIDGQVGATSFVETSAFAGTSGIPSQASVWVPQSSP